MNWTREVIYGQAGNSNQEIMTQMAIIFENKLKMIEEASLELMADDDVQQILSRAHPMDDSQQITSQSQKMETALLHFTRRTGLKDVTLYHDKWNLIVPYNYKFKTLNEASSQAWFSRAIAAKGAPVLYSDTQSSGYDPNKTVLVLVRQIKNIFTNRVIGYMKIDIPASYFTQILNQSHAVKTGTSLLLNANHAVISRTENSELNRWIDRQTDSGIFYTMTNTLVEWRPDKSMPKYLVFQKPINDELYLVNLVEKRDVLEASYIIQRLESIIFSLAILLAIFLMFSLHKMFIKPLFGLTKLMRRLKEGNMDFQIPYMNRSDEIGFIFRSFNTMISNLKHLINQVYFERLHKQEAELRALQSQIDPHLLYNTLDSINLLAIKNNVPDIQEMIGSLSKFFRISLSKGKNIITIHEELSHAKAFLTLQKYRINYTLSISYDIEDAILDNETVKCILQPIIENCLFHGFSNQTNATLVIRGYSLEEQIICLEVHDNGKGFPIGKWEEIITSQGAGHYGMWNVHQRIQLVYGPQYGISVFSAGKPGTVIQIILPNKKFAS